LGDRSARQLVFSPDDSRLFVAGEGVTVVDPLREGTLLRFQPCDDDIYYLSIASDGRRLASCTTGGMISIVSCGQSHLIPQTIPASSRTAIQETPWSIESSRIVYSAVRDGQRNLFLFDRTSGETKQLTREEAKEHGANNPRPSRDGKRVVYQRLLPGNYDLGLLSIGDAETSVLVENPAYEVSPIWSPDGRRIAFMSTRGFELGSIGPFPGHIYSQEAAGGEPVQLTREPLTSSLGPSDWSPDGASLLLSRYDGERIRIYSLEVASGKERPITDSPHKDYSAVYSSDGKRIAFHSETEGGANIVVCDLDGRNRLELTADGFNYGPRWSPDNRWLLFTRSKDGQQHDIYAINVDTKELIAVVATEEDEREGNWLR
jgi:TolB protein